MAFESLQYESEGMIWKTDVTVGGQEVAVELDTRQTCMILGIPSQSVKQDNFFFEMVDRQTLSNPLFGVALSRRGHSELSLGGVNSSLYDDLTFVPLVGEHGFWEIEGFILVGDRALPQVFIMDSTAHVIDMSRDSATILFQLLGLRIVWSPNGSLIGVYHCTRPPVISFQFGPWIITLNPTDIKLGYHNRTNGECLVAIVGGAQQTNKVILGHPFFLSTYLTFGAHDEEVGIGMRQNR
ncbi:hypothetical protein V8E36_001633 [Tilletia maclaganii]